MRILDVEDAPGFVALLRALGRGYVPEWSPRDRGPDAALVEIAAHDLQAVARRLERAPAKNALAFLEMLGVRVIPAQPARAPIVVQLSDGAADVRMPAGTRVAAPPPPGASTPTTYETERSTGVAAAPLAEVVSLWPGRDEYADHSADVVAGRPVRLFDPLALTGTPHALYIAHDTLLALAGRSAVTVTFELTTGSSAALDLRWEYWDGALWRPFKDMRPECSNAEAAQLDSTGGLRRSGAYRLEADCAQSAPRAVGGITGRWIRARLEATLPPNPARVLPEVTQIRLSTEVTQSFAEMWAVSIAAATDSRAVPGTVPVHVRDASGVPLAGVRLAAASTERTTLTGDDVTLGLAAGTRSTVGIGVDGFAQQVTVDLPATPVEMTVALDLAAMDRAVVDGAAVDLSKPFHPFGAQPRPGSALYFSHAEAFAKPGARLRIWVQPASTPQDAVDGGSPVDRVVSWEYFDGSRWVSLLTATAIGPTGGDLTELAVVALSVPSDMTPTTVAGQEALWMRVRLVSGGFGVTRTVTFTTGTGDTAKPTTLKFFEPHPPVLGDLRLGWAWQQGPLPAEHVLAHNDFAYEDRTAAATWPGAPFQPFEPVRDATPALYLGFDGALPVDDLGVWLDVLEQRGDPEGPALVWEYSDGIAWQRLTVDDETRELRVPGIVSFIGPEDMGAIARFGTPRHWFRARLAADGPPGAPTLQTILPNAVWASQRQTVVDEPLGAATGQPGEVLTFRQVPILPGQVVEVRELAGARANIEWRLLAAELLPDPERAIQDIETALAAEGDADEIERGPLRLRRDRLKRVTEAWVRWAERPSLLESTAADRHYALDRARGRLHFGARVAPPGASVAARAYRTGGGSAGNVPARAITQLLGPVGGVQAVFNPAPAEGGSDAENAEQVAVRGPWSVRHRGRAVTAGDLETMAAEASPSVAVARAIPGRDASGRPAPGWVTLVIAPRSAEPRPYPSFGLREDVRRYVAARAGADVAAAGRIVVTGPDYEPVDVTAAVVPVVASEAGAVERAAHEAVATFLHPLRGGPSGRGWAPGAEIFVSDLAAVIEHVDGVDYSLELALVRAGAAQGERLRLAADRLPVAGSIRLRLVEG